MMATRQANHLPRISSWCSRLFFTFATYVVGDSYSAGICRKHAYEQQIHDERIGPRWLAATSAAAAAAMFDSSTYQPCIWQQCMFTAVSNPRR
jgi:hypothetical protein